VEKLLPFEEKGKQFCGRAGAVLVSDMALGFTGAEKLVGTVMINASIYPLVSTTPALGAPPFLV